MNCIFHCVLANASAVPVEVNKTLEQREWLNRNLVLFCFRTIGRSHHEVTWSFSLTTKHVQRCVANACVFVCEFVRVVHVTRPVSGNDRNWNIKYLFVLSVVRIVFQLFVSFFFVHFLSCWHLFCKISLEVSHVVLDRNSDNYYYCFQMVEKPNSHKSPQLGMLDNSAVWMRFVLSTYVLLTHTYTRAQTICNRMLAAWVRPLRCGHSSVGEKNVTESVFVHRLGRSLFTELWLSFSVCFWPVERNTNSEWPQHLHSKVKWKIAQPIAAHAARTHGRRTHLMSYFQFIWSASNKYELLVI